MLYALCSLFLFFTVLIDIILVRLRSLGRNTSFEKEPSMSITGSILGVIGFLWYNKLAAKVSARILMVINITSSGKCCETGALTFVLVSSLLMNVTKILECWSNECPLIISEVIVSYSAELTCFVLFWIKLDFSQSFYNYSVAIIFMFVFNISWISFTSAACFSFLTAFSLLSTIRTRR